MPRPDRQGTLAGLTSAEAARRLRQWGPNLLAPARRFETARQIAGWLGSPLILILLLASGISAALGPLVGSAVIALMVVLGAGLNATQAYRSQAAAKRLRERVGQRATVVRDGAARDIPAREVVPGDVVQLAAGDRVPAGGALVSAKDLFLNEAPLTGESLPVEKHGGARVLRGTSVVSGVGVALVEATGRATEFGRIAAHLVGRPPETEFERGTRRFGFLILQVVIFLVLFVFLVNALLRRDLLESFMFSVALAVGLTPELLPMIVSVTLASGAVRMARKKVIVKQLAAIENFGSMDILCSGEITVDRHVNLRGERDDTVIRLAALNSVYQTGLRSLMDDAILRLRHPAVAEYACVDEIPFDFARRRMSVVVEDGGDRLLITKGAPESVLPACARVDLDGIEERAGRNGRDVPRARRDREGSFLPPTSHVARRRRKP
jgi:P-type Mg2+ transporter